jgi:hypothetical protein
VTYSNSEDFISYVNEDGEHIDEYLETVEFWPPPSKRKRPNWMYELNLVNRDLGRLFEDVFKALDNNLDVLAAIGMRTVFDCSSELLKVEPNQTFAKKLKALRDKNIIVEKERAVLEVLVDAGSAAAHRGWRPGADELAAMMVILESFLQRAFFLDKTGEGLAKKVPSKD